MDAKPSFIWVGRRGLPRPQEDIEDQGLGFDVGTLLARRKVLSAFGLGALGLGLAACQTGGGDAASPSDLAEIPDETAGPYPGDGSNGPDVLEDSGVVRSDITSSFGDASGVAEGVPLTIDLTILDLANGGAPYAGAAVYVWHCDREGRYSMYSEGAENENYLRGAQITDDAGTVRFTSIFPACYTGRWPHIHFEVYPDRDSIADAANAIAVSQIALPQDACDAVYASGGYESSVSNLEGVTLTSDNVFGDDGGAAQLATVSGSVGSGYTASLAAAVDASTEPSAGAAPGGAGGAGGPEGQPPFGEPGGEPPQG